MVEVRQLLSVASVVVAVAQSVGHRVPCPIPHAVVLILKCKRLLRLLEGFPGTERPQFPVAH